MSERATHSWLRRVGIGAVAAGMTLGVVGVTVNTASADHGPKVTICHATNSNVNPYTTFVVNESAADGLVPPQGDHYHLHTGPVWDPTLKADGIDWGDIIPPVPGHHDGLNWTVDGQAIWNNGCAIPGAANTYECSAATAVTHDSATLHAATSDAAVTEAVFTLSPGNITRTDSTGPSPFSVDATGLDPSTAYTYSVEFNPGATPQSNAACELTTLAAPIVPTYECSAATLVTHDSATLNGSTTDAAATSAVFTLVGPGGSVMNDNDGAPFTVDATGLTASTVYTYSVAFDGNQQGNAACEFTTLAAPGGGNPGGGNPGGGNPGGGNPGGGNPGGGNPGGGTPAPALIPPVQITPPAVRPPAAIPVVLPDVVEAEAPVVPEAPAEAPTIVAGIQVTRELPRTGSTALPLLQVGLGLILLGAGAMLFGRERTALI